MSTLTLPAASDEYIKTRVSARVSGSVVDPTAGTVEFQAVALGTLSAALEEADWVAGGWETVDVETYKARILLSDLGLAAGTWEIWIRIANAPETPVRKVGRLVLV